MDSATSRAAVAPAFDRPGAEATGTTEKPWPAGLARKALTTDSSSDTRGEQVE